MTCKITNTNIGQIEYSIRGKGSPVLVMHGGHSNANETLTTRSVDLNEFRVITPSRPGYGNTPLSKNTTPEGAAKQIAELMSHLGYSSFAVIGISAGGPTAISMASLFPEKVDKLVLASAVTKRWLYPQDQLYKKAGMLFGPGRERLTWGLLKFFLKVFPRVIIAKMASELTTRKITNISEEHIEAMKSLLLTSRSKNGFVADLEHDLEEDVLEKVEAPTLIVHSRNDKSVDQSHPRHAKSKIRNARLKWIDNEWGHMIWFDASATECINGFLLNGFDDLCQ